MGLFSLFRKKKPYEVYQALAQKIVLSSLEFRQDLDASDNEHSADAGAELIYLLLHLLDQRAFAELGASGRDEVFDNILLIVLDDYVRALINAKTPQELQDSIKEKMIIEMNTRQSIYSQCDSFLGDPLPSRGTIIFAFSFYVHKALGNTERTDVDEILIGNQELGDSDFEDFPEFTKIIEQSVSVTAMLETLEIGKELKHLK